MENKRIITLAMAAAVSMAAMVSAHATDSKSGYLQGTSGLSFGHTEIELEFENIEASANDEGFNGRIGIGAYVNNDFRVGVEGGYATFSEDGVDIDTWDILAVAYYDFNNETNFTPFVGFGAGLAQQKLKLDDGETSYTETTNHLALKVGSGVGYAITENIELLAEYSFQYHVAAELVDGVDISASQNQFNVGLRYSF